MMSVVRWRCIRTRAALQGSQAPPDELGGPREIEVCDPDIEGASPIRKLAVYKWHPFLAPKVGTAGGYDRATPEAVPIGTSLSSPMRPLASG